MLTLNFNYAHEEVSETKILEFGDKKHLLFDGPKKSTTLLSKVHQYPYNISNVKVYQTNISSIGELVALLEDDNSIIGVISTELRPTINVTHPLGLTEALLNNLFPGRFYVYSLPDYVEEKITDVVPYDFSKCSMVNNVPFYGEKRKICIDRDCFLIDVSKENILIASNTNPNLSQFLVPVYSMFKQIVLPAYDVLVANEKRAYSLFGFTHANVDPDGKICFGGYSDVVYPQKLITLKEMNYTSAFKTSMPMMTIRQYHTVCRVFINSTIKLIDNIEVV